MPSRDHCVKSPVITTSLAPFARTVNGTSRVPVGADLLRSVLVDSIQFSLAKIAPPKTLFVPGGGTRSHKGSQALNRRGAKLRSGVHPGLEARHLSPPSIPRCRERSL